MISLSLPRSVFRSTSISSRRFFFLIACVRITHLKDIECFNPPDRDWRNLFLLSPLCCSPLKAFSPSRRSLVFFPPCHLVSSFVFHPLRGFARTPSFLFRIPPRPRCNLSHSHAAFSFSQVNPSERRYHRFEQTKRARSTLKKKRKK